MDNGFTVRHSLVPVNIACVMLTLLFVALGLNLFEFYLQISYQCCFMCMCVVPLHCSMFAPFPLPYFSYHLSVLNFVCVNVENFDG